MLINALYNAKVAETAVLFGNQPIIKPKQKSKRERLMLAVIEMKNKLPKQNLNTPKCK